MWTSVNISPSISKKYLVKYKEYLGTTEIYGFKIIDWDNGFKLEPRQVAYEYTDIPENILRRMT
jgi:hypothetical protein